MISAISSQGSVRFMVYQDTMNQQRLIRFMQRLIRTSEQEVFLILDNLKVHHGKLAAAWLEKNKEKLAFLVSGAGIINILPAPAPGHGLAAVSAPQKAAE